MTRFLLGVALFTICASLLNAQNFSLSGSLAASDDNNPVIGAYVTAMEISDSTATLSTVTDAYGKFRINKLKRGEYKLTIRSVGYTRIDSLVKIRAIDTDLGTLKLKTDSKILKEVIVTGQGTAVQNGDTTVMKADAFKVNPDADAEDLVKKMPGITIENGTVKAHGEEIKKVLVDGKPFFGDDPSVALKNLPADVIDKVQVYNKLSDQAELTGFDDGSSSKTINIVTRKNARFSQFGKLSTGTDFTDKYLLAGNLNLFKGPRRFTLTGMSNNVNMQNFAMEDLIGASATMNNRGHGYSGRLGSSGISRNTSAGLNYSDNWGKKITASASYFFNTTSNILKKETSTQYLFTEAGKYSTESSASNAENYNHRFNLRIEYNIDTLNSIILVPRFSMQQNTNRNDVDYYTGGGGFEATTFSTNKNESNGNSFGYDLTWRHKFLKKGRTLSIRSSLNENTRYSNNTQFATTDSIPDNQYADGNTKGFNMNTNLNYTEPLGKFSLLQFNLNNNFNRNKTDKETFRLGDGSERLGRLDSLSNVFDNDYITNRAGLSWLYQKENFRFSAGMNYQRADLTGDQVFPQRMSINRSFSNFLPNIMINYKISEITNLRVSYRTSTDAPSVNQLQNVVDNSNRLSLSSGNPALKQEYSHRLMGNVAYANPTTGFNAFLFLTGSYTSDVIANRTLYARKSTIYLPEFNVTLQPGGQLTYPVNMDHAMNLRAIVSLAYFIKPLKSNLNFVTGVSYSQLPGYIDSLLNRSNSWNLSNSLILTSNISSDLDFTFSYTSSYSTVKNTAQTENRNEKYWYQSASGNVNWIFLKGFTLNSDFVFQYNQGLSASYNQQYFVWNASAGRKFLKKQAAEIRLGVYDILNQNDNISRTVTASSIIDSRTNAYKRYFLVVLRYNLKSRNGQPDQPPSGQRQFERRDGSPREAPPGRQPGGFYHRD